MTNPALLGVNPLQDLADNFRGFIYGSNYRDGEKEFEKLLIKENFSKIEFYNIERDSFGPLIRGISAEQRGYKYKASYG